MRVHPSSVRRLILTVRGQRIILSSDLARVYEVEVKVLNQAVKRNPGRFPRDFAFRLTRSEAEEIRRSRSQIVTLKRGQNLKYRPLAFTEHGAVMAASVLNSEKAVSMSVFVVRAFLRLRAWVATHAGLAARLAELERRVGSHDRELRDIIIAIRTLIQAPASTERKRIGFLVTSSKAARRDQGP